MSVQRDSIVKGPGSVFYNAGDVAEVVFHDKEGIKSELITSTEKLPSSIFGKLASRLNDQIGKTTFTPVGVLSAEILAALYPAAYTTPSIGASLFGAADVPICVHSKAGTKLTWVNGAFTTMPEIMLSARKTALGSAELTHVLKYNADRTAAGSMYAIASEAYADAGFSESDIKMVPYVGTWGAILPGIQAAEGWTITPTLEIEAREVDDMGTIDFYLKSVEISAKCRPLGLSETNILSNLPSEQNIGSVPTNQADLTIAGTGGLTVVLKNATLLEGPLQYGNTELRAGELMWTANPDVSAGGALFSVALT